MNIKNPLKKFFTVILWCLVGGAGLALLVAAINSKNTRGCRGLEVEINEGSKARFLNKKDLVTMLENNGLRDWHNKKTASFNLLQMETMLRKNSWIRDVQIYFDNNDILKIRVQEREPAARLFTASGNSFLIDSSGVQMPLSERNVFRLPVFTGYPSEKFSSEKDSILNRQIKDLTIFLNRDVFWSCQIQEVHINAAKNFQMTPLIGSQQIDLGDGTDIENKFHRLFIFYKDVITRTGFEKYVSINLAFANQVIATRKQGFVSRADSIQAHKNIMDMIRKAQKMDADTTKIREVKPLEKNTLTEQNLRSYDFPAETNDQIETGNKHQKQQ
jgi:cell division protein FtsQ